MPFSSYLGCAQVLWRDSSLRGVVVSPLQNSKLEDHPLSDVFDCLLNIFAALLSILGLYVPHETWALAIQLGQRVHSTLPLDLSMWKFSSFFQNLCSKSNITLIATGTI
jgi:hypothetical protein